jgi:hypothetical protein
MPGTFTCRHCGKIMPRNPRLKKNKQSYCNAPKCKQSKKSARKKERYHTDPSYRQNHLDGQKLWRSNRPAHEYQNQYRESHPEYVEGNRKLQSERNCRRKERTASMIVNGTPLSLQASNDNAYAITGVKREKIVNGTPLSLHTSIDNAYAINRVKGEKIVNGTPFLAQIQIITGKEAFFLQIGK